MTQHAREVRDGERFEFGANWSRFLRLLDDERIASAELSLRTLLGVDSLQGKRFIDVGSGSGLFSLAARRLGAEVRSFDYDDRSVACTAELRRRYLPDDPSWSVAQGSVLDKEFLAALGSFDVVYSWGVLHHTGEMWQAIANAAALVAPSGRFAIAIYNDQGALSRYWTVEKRTYCRLPWTRPILIALHSPIWAARVLARALSGRLREQRGMSYWHDLIDWLGGYPFEVASVAEVVRRVEAMGFATVLVRGVGHRSGCNEFVFERSDSAVRGASPGPKPA